MKKYIRIFFIFVCLSLFLSTTILYKSNKRNKQLYLQEFENCKAYATENTQNKEQVKQFQFTINNLKNSNDSINKKLLSVVNELKIKEKSLQNIQYRETSISKTDTVLLNDTIFIANTLIDTLIKDAWYSVSLKLSYPNSIIITPSFYNESYIITHEKKEFVNAKSKVFFIRWFQRKYKTVEITVKDKNPYVENKEVRFIKIIK